MANFPDKEADVVALVQSMIAGYTAHAVDFPSADPIGLQAALSGFLTDNQSQDDAKAQAQIATTTKTGTLDTLESLMKDSLKASELDVASDPDKLLEIGWGPKVAPVPISAPDAPSNLMPTYEGPGDLTLQWDKPVHDPNRPAVNYAVERRDQPAGGGEFGEWIFVDMTYKNQIDLTGQPRGIQMEYKVMATNAAGQSGPSNTAAVVL